MTKNKKRKEHSAYTHTYSRYRNLPGQWFAGRCQRVFYFCYSYTYIHIYYARRVYYTISGSYTTTMVYVRSVVQRRRHKSSAQLTSGRNYGEWPCWKHPAAVAKALYNMRCIDDDDGCVFYLIIPTPTYLEYLYIFLYKHLMFYRICIVYYLYYCIVVFAGRKFISYVLYNIFYCAHMSYCIFCVYSCF